MAAREDELDREDLLALVKTGSELAAQIDLDDLLHGILLRAGELTDSPDGCVLLHDREKDGLYFADAIGDNAPTLLQAWGEASDRRVPTRGSKAGDVFTSGRSLVVDLVAADPSHFKQVDEETQHDTRSMVCVPLSAAGERLGAMQVLNKRSGNYSSRDRVLLERFADQAAIAIRNARLIQGLLARMGLLASRSTKAGTLELLDELNRGEARTERMTMLFADMRGFTQLCQVLNSPESVQRLLNEFLGMLFEQVIRHDGIVNKFLGDGVLALFRREDHAPRAVRCAFAMLERFEAIRQAWDQDINAQLDFLDLGIGISTDHVIIGSIGSARVRDFTAIGTAVILAAAFEKCARDGRRILVDKVTYGAVKDMVAEIEGPVPFDLRKPGQGVGHPYSQYHLKSLVPTIRTRVFISHSHADRDFVEAELVGPLARYGIDTWYSGHDIAAGARWVGEISEGLSQSNVFLVVVSRNSASSKWVRTEVDMAAATGLFEDKIIPIVLDDAAPEQVNPFLRHLQNYHIREGVSIAQQIVAIIQSKV